MPDHFAYGLRFRSPFLFPELALAGGEDGAPDVELEVGPIGVERPDGIDDPGWFLARGDDLALHWPEYGSARVRDGRSIRLDALADLDPAWKRAVVLGTLFSILLQQRGVYPLHAAAARIGDGARALVGDSGAGKSSLVATLALRGHLLIGDDVLPLEPRPDGPPRAWPGRAEPKLDEDAARALGIDLALLAPLPREEGERRLVSGFERSTGTCGLGALYVLEWGDGPRIEPLAPQETFRTFLRHGHRGELLAPAFGEEERMRRCAALAERTPAFRLVRPHGWPALAEAAELVEEHDPDA